jgi:hypothetical protein
MFQYSKISINTVKLDMRQTVLRDRGKIEQLDMKQTVLRDRGMFVSLIEKQRRLVFT